MTAPSPSGSHAQGPIAVTGVGVVSSIGRGVASFAAALRAGRIGVRAVEGPGPLRVAALLGELELATEIERVLVACGRRPDELATRAVRSAARAQWSVRTGVAAAFEAWLDAELDRSILAPERVAVVAVSPPGPAHRDALDARYRDRLVHAPPTYALQHLDTELVSTWSEIVGAHGEGFSVGGASASGQTAIVKGAQLVRHGLADVCIVIAGAAHLGALEIAALANLGALRCDPGSGPPEAASRPFDRAAAGFVYGQGAAALVLESEASARARRVATRCTIRGIALCLSGTRAPTPSADAEARVMQSALRDAGLDPTDIDYVNAHATSSPLGDQAEAHALGRVFTDHGARPRVSSTKALMGHCLGSAGALEMIATISQMSDSVLHPQPHLEDPIDPELAFVARACERAEVRRAISSSFGFGGIHTTLVLERGAPSHTGGAE
ncbi:MULTISPECIES: beta-ketoacyl synthase N-terminal-like domain-containing protein [Sandaracinus]|uniref:beta-ketoacyl synthase N-terminal-like domain-containing protein n=1 Tax=Sandaracinus TaxID=1055688 RepID=UPI0019D412C5|nr:MULTISPECIES: beta-ketoacyl synthase N-terminal-like domain-containing protein [Sandaracinus]QRN75760.1 Beta-ketoacyl-ACP synthase [Sandaracinus sp.]UJR87260.1 Polyketide biosynthesis malonyl-ACP decarboxylase PksF [Sandaracinus amylolyticus]